MVSFRHLKKQPLFLSCDPPPLHHSFLPTLRPEQSLIQVLSLWVFPIEDILHLWTSIICGLLWLIFFTASCFQGCLWYSMYQHFFSLCCQTVLHCTATPHLFIHLFIYSHLDYIDLLAFSSAYQVYNLQIFFPLHELSILIGSFEA